MENNKKRGKRVTNEQRKIMVDFVSENQIILSGKCHPLQTKELDEKWAQLSELLNSETDGAKKDVTQWKHVSKITFKKVVKVFFVKQITYGRFYKGCKYKAKSIIYFRLI